MKLGPLAVREPTPVLLVEANGREGLDTESARSAIRHALAPIGPLADALRRPIGSEELLDSLAEIAAMGAKQLGAIRVDSHMDQLPFTRESVERDLGSARAVLLGISVLAEDLFWESRDRQYTTREDAAETLTALVAQAVALGAV